MAGAKESGGAAGRTIRRIIVVTTYGGSWWLVRVALGDPARKVVSRAVRSLCARGCRVDRYVHYNMDHSTPRRLSGFLDRVRAGVSRLLAAPGAFPEIPMPHPHRIEGYAIVSEDGMLANAAGVMPDALQFEADKHFFEQGLDGVDIVVHGRNSHERQPRSYLRRRLILTRQIPAIAADPSNEKALFWNPAGASFEEALALLGKPDGRIGIIGGTDVFAMFLDRYDVFHLSRAPDVRLPGGRPVFPDVPTRTPEEVLASNGLDQGQRQVLDPAYGLSAR